MTSISFFNPPQLVRLHCPQSLPPGLRQDPVPDHLPSEGVLRQPAHLLWWPGQAAPLVHDLWGEVGRPASWQQSGNGVYYVQKKQFIPNVYSIHVYIKIICTLWPVIYNFMRLVNYLQLIVWSLKKIKSFAAFLNYPRQFS